MYILTHTHKWRKKELLPLATWMDLETVMLSEDREKINTVWHYLYVEPKKKSQNHRNGELPGLGGWEK